MVVGAIDFDWRDNLDIKSLQHVSPMTNEERDNLYMYDIDNIYNQYNFVQDKRILLTA